MEVEYSKKGSRKFSQFVVESLLYDYIVGQLDNERAKGVEQGLKDFPECKLKYNQMRKAMEYSQELRQVQVTQEAVENLYEPSNYFSVLFRKTQFEKWPSTVKWSIEAMVVFAGVILFLIVVPWEGVIKSTLTSKDRDVILTEINKNSFQNSMENLAEIEKKETPQFTDEGKKSETTPPTPPATAQADKPVDVAKATNGDKPKTEGFLYRGELFVTNVDMVAPKIKDKIINLGGRKAGEVELGWKKGASTYYYHFTIPEAKYDEFVIFLESYSKAKISKEKHPRIMPDGIIRLIMTVDEKTK